MANIDTVKVADIIVNARVEQSKDRTAIETIFCVVKCTL
jgi:hypothetical protein